MNTPANIEEARAWFCAFVGSFDADSRVVIFHDSDADGVTAAVVLEKALARLGRSTSRIMPSRDRNAWSEANRAAVAALSPTHLFVLDMGTRTEPLIEGARECIIDHHLPDGSPAERVLITAYDWSPIPNTSHLTWELCAAITDVSDLDWIAAIGVISDLGEKAPFPMLAEAKKKHSAKYLKEATTLINSARRASHYDPESAARALSASHSPRAFVESELPELTAMRAARKEVQAELEEAKKAAPVFAGNVALLRMRSRCQIHPLIAQIWRTRLPKYMVFAANETFLEGRVNFSARSSGNTNVLQFLRGLRDGDENASYGHGHDQASGGSLTYEEWNALLAKVGFGPEVFVKPDTLLK